MNVMVSDLPAEEAFQEELNGARFPEGQSKVMYGIGSEKSETMQQGLSCKSTRSANANRNRQLLNGIRASGMDEAVSAVVSFSRDEEDLLRASRLYAVLGRCSKILSQARGSAETYALSEQVKAISVFISHNWAVARSKKFLCLALYFNMPWAVGATFVLVAVIALLEVGFDVRPLAIETPPFPDSPPGTGRIKCGILSQFLLAPVFLSVLLFGHEFRRLVGFRGCTVFLDKTCIEQVDKKKQQAGIHKLGAFLSLSGRMMVVYSDIYLHKLWTVYEVACFLAVHPPHHLTVIPTFQPLVILGLFVSLVVAGWVNALGQLAGGDGINPLGYVWLLLGTYSFTVVLRHWARTKQMIIKRVENFQVRECTCYHEDDRPFVYQNIAVLMRATGEAGSNATDDQALDAFDALARRKLSRCVINSIGHLGLSYFQVCFTIVCAMMPGSLEKDAFGVMPYPEDWTARNRIATPINVWFWAFVGNALTLAMLSLWSGRCLHLRGCCQWAYLFAGVIMVLIPLTITNWYWSRLQWAWVTTGSALAAVGMVLVPVFGSLLAFAVFNWGRRRTEEEENSIEEENEDEVEKEEVQIPSPSFGAQGGR